MKCFLIDQPQTRKIFINGNSKGITLPQEWREMLLGKENCDTGELVAHLLSLQDNRKVIVVGTFELKGGTSL